METTKRKLYTAEQLAEQLQVKRQTIYSWARRGQIECFRVGRLVRFYDPTEDEKRWN